MWSFGVVNVSGYDKGSKTRRVPTFATSSLFTPVARSSHMGGKKKSSLQTALLNQQSRLKQKAQIAQAAKLNEKTKVAKKQHGKKTVTIPFAPTDKILLIGEGDFSFAHALAVDPPAQLQHLPPQNITATAYDSEEECLTKYADAQEKINALRVKGVRIIFGVDATKLEKVSQLKGKQWDKVVWNFPHAGRCGILVVVIKTELTGVLQGRVFPTRIGIFSRTNF